jgi:superfamily II DNA/RNA helicase
MVFSGLIKYGWLFAMLILWLNRVLIFTLYKVEAAQLQLRLQAKGYKVQSIHGDKGQVT